MYTHLLVRRYLTTRIIPLIAVAAVALCVALVIVVVSVMTGFLDALRSSGKTLMGDVVVSYQVQGIPYYEELLKELGTVAEVEAATPLVDAYGLIRMPYPDGANKDVITANIWAIEPESFERVTGYKDVLYWKRPSEEAAKKLKPDDPRLFIDREWEAAGLALKDPAGKLPAAVIGIHVSIVYQRQDDGSYRLRQGAERWWDPFPDLTITLVPISQRGTVSTASNRVFKVVNETMSGVFQVDKSRVFIPLAEGQEMLRMNAAPRVDLNGEPDSNGNYPVIGTTPARATLVLVRAKNTVTPAQLSEAVKAAYRRFYERVTADPKVLDWPPLPVSDAGRAVGEIGIQTWEERLRDLIGPVERERQMMRILFSITYLVCAGLILAIFWSIVSEKTRDIGILRAVGGSRLGVLWIFLSYGLAVGVAGSALGTLLGWIVVRHINDIHTALGHNAPKWSWIVGFMVTAVVVVMALVSLLRQRALAALMWSVAAIAVAGVSVGLKLHQGFLVWDPAVYYFARIPSDVDWPSALGTCLGAVIFSVLGAAVPAARAADVDPVQALRYE